MVAPGRGVAVPSSTPVRRSWPASVMETAVTNAGKDLGREFRRLTPGESVELGAA